MMLSLDVAMLSLDAMVCFPRALASYDNYWVLSTESDGNTCVKHFLNAPGNPRYINTSLGVM